MHAYILSIYLPARLRTCVTYTIYCIQAIHYPNKQTIPQIAYFILFFGGLSRGQRQGEKTHFGVAAIHSAQVIHSRCAASGRRATAGSCGLCHCEMVRPRGIIQPPGTNHVNYLGWSTRLINPHVENELGRNGGNLIVSCGMFVHVCTLVLRISGFLARSMRETMKLGCPGAKHL